MKITYPDYKNSSVNLSNSILKHYNLKTNHPTLQIVDEALAKNYKNVVLLILDGLGTNLMQQHLAADAFLRKHKVKDITSVFPATTTAATTSLLTGMVPAEHGWLGWDLYFKSVDKTVTTFLNTIKDKAGKQAANYHLAQTELPITTIIDQINHSKAASGYWLSPFADDVLAAAVKPDAKKFINLIDYDLNNLDILFDNIKTLCTTAEQKFIYAYSLEPDSLMHQFGTNDQRITEIINYLDKKTAQLSKQLDDTLLIITADHGHITAGEYFFLNEYPKIKKMLRRQTSIESRCVNFFIKASKHADFEIEFNKNFSDYFILYTKQEVKDNQLFGPGIPHEKFETFLGDYLAVAISDKSIMDQRVVNPLKGTHAGVLAAETVVPLVMVSHAKGLKTDE